MFKNLVFNGKGITLEKYKQHKHKDNTMTHTATHTATLTAEVIAQEILKNHPSIEDWDTCDTSEVFTHYSKKYGYPVRSYVSYKKGGKSLTTVFRANDCRSIVIWLLKNRVISRETARPIVGDACLKCGGIGFLPQYAHIENGLCFKCNGSGNN